MKHFDIVFRSAAFRFVGCKISPLCQDMKRRVPTELGERERQDACHEWQRVIAQYYHHNSLFVCRSMEEASLKRHGFTLVGMRRKKSCYFRRVSRKQSYSHLKESLSVDLCTILSLILVASRAMPGSCSLLPYACMEQTNEREKETISRCYWWQLTRWCAVSMMQTISSLSSVSIPLSLLLRLVTRVYLLCYHTKLFPHRPRSDSH